MPFFNNIPQLPEDPILGVPLLFAADSRSNKINLGIGAYKTAEGQPNVLASVRKAESLLLQKNLNKEYLPIEGDHEFLKLSLILLLGNNSQLFESNRIFAAQTVGGASALRIGGEFFSKLIGKSVFIPQPSWSNHKQIFERAGLNVGSYPYYNHVIGAFDFQGMLEAIKNMPKKSLILLHGCCHNPTAIDPAPEQWSEISQLIKKYELCPFFDIAYQGFGNGLEQDAEAIRFFVKEGHEMFIAYSFSKNFGLYGERIGFLTTISSESESVPKIGSQIKSLIRGNYSNPPIHGARIVSTILKSHELSMEWKTELQNMSERIKEMRKALIAALHVEGQHRNFSHLQQQNGLFFFLGLNPTQVQKLRDDFAIYTPSNGRINLAGLNSQNVPIVAKALLSIL